MADLDAVNQAAPAAVGAIAGGGGVLWIAKLLLGRMIEQYDKRHDDHASEQKKLSDRLAEAHTQIEVLKALFQDAKNLRVETQEKISKLEGQMEAKQNALLEEIRELRADVFVAHERIRYLASGNDDIETIQKPSNVKRRV